VEKERIMSMILVKDKQIKDLSDQLNAVHNEMIKTELNIKLRDDQSLSEREENNKIFSKLSSDIDKRISENQKIKLELDIASE
jgi:hypothetical protein